MLGSGATTASSRDAVLWRAPIDPERDRELRHRIRATLTAALNPPPSGSTFRLQVKAVGKHRKIKLGDWRQPWLRVAGALLLVVSACIHLVLYLTGYRSIPTIGWLAICTSFLGVHGTGGRTRQDSSAVAYGVDASSMHLLQPLTA